MKILIINNSNKYDIEIESILNDYFVYLNNFCAIIPRYEIMMASDELRKEVVKMNAESQNITQTFIEYFQNNAYLELKGELAKHFKVEELSQSKTIILSKDSKISYPWGEANSFLAVIKNITKYNIWHEFSHTFGLDDHYYQENKKEKSICTLENCIMRYGKSSLEFCESGKLELRRLVNEIVNIA